jgi:putative ABC transport system substrate-binding protein
MPVPRDPGVTGRRQFLAALGVATLSLPIRAGAQPRTPLPRIGYVSVGSRDGVTAAALDHGLRELGYVHGQTALLEMRYGNGDVSRLPALIQELLALKVHVLVATSPYGIRAALQATRTVPLVGLDLESDPVEAGFVPSLARPGGNFTGFFLDLPELGGKQIELLREAVPRLARVAVLWDVNVAGTQFGATEAAARAAGVRLQSLPVQHADELRGALEKAARESAQGLIFLSSPLVFRSRKRLAELARAHRLPAISIFPQFADEGGLLGYGPDLADLMRRGVAGYVDRILRGAKPGDLPIQRPVRFDLVVNLKTAQVLGLQIPQVLLMRADRVVQ